MLVTPAKLRANLYQILDEVLATGKTVEILHKGRTLRIVPDQPASKLARLKKRDIFVGDPDGIMGMDWSKEWLESRRTN